MTLFTGQSIAQSYVALAVADVTYRRRASVSANFSTGVATPTNDDDATLSVLRGPITHEDDARRGRVTERIYSCLVDDDQTVSTTTVSALATAPAVGDLIVDGSDLWAVAAFETVNDGLEYKLRCRRE